MKTIFLSALCTVSFAVAFAACGSDDNDGDGPIITRVDSGTGATPDAAPACNPVTQAGCEAGQKCAQLVANDDDPSMLLKQTACVPDGTVTEDGACKRGAVGATGYDNCVAGYTCIRSMCAKICTSTGGDTCRTPETAFDEGGHCVRYHQLFDDNVGACAPACHPTADTVADTVVTHTSCNAYREGFSCNLSLSGGGAASCGGVPMQALVKQQGEDCYGPMANQCYLNGCAAGYGALLPDKQKDPQTSSCVRFCTPKNSHKADVTKKDGDAAKCSTGNLGLAGSSPTAAKGYECRFLNSIYSDTSELSNELGVCADADEWTSCADFDWDSMRTMVLGAADTDAANLVYNQFCYGKDMPAMSDTLDAKCIGLFRGCLDDAETVEFFVKTDGPAAGPAKSNLRKRYQDEMVRTELADSKL